MLDSAGLAPPPVLAGILTDTEAAGFEMSSEPRTGALLRTLAASRLGGSILELGTGTGVAAAWIVDGMDAGSRLLSVDNDASVLRVAERHLGRDDRVRFELADGAEVIRSLGAGGRQFDLIFADTWPGKFTHLDETLELLKSGGLYLVDDLLMQPSWPEDHVPKVFDLLTTLSARQDLRVVRLNWSSGVLIAAKIAASHHPPDPGRRPGV